MNGPFLLHDRVRMFAAGVAGAGAMMVVSRAARSPVVADAIVWASQGDRRNVYVGWPTVRAVIGNRIAPGYLDRYLSRHGYESQQAGTPEDPQRPHNLWQPLDEDCDFGAHGRFDDRAHSASWHFWATRHRSSIAAAAAVVGVAGVAALFTRRG